MNSLRLSLIWLAGLAACHTQTRTAADSDQPIASHEASHAAASKAPSGEPKGHPADVGFMMDMIAHHEQALAMTALVPTRATRQELHLLAERMEVSQRDEIQAMRQWLSRHNRPVPEADEHRVHSCMPHMAMPGMIRPAELQEISRLKGGDFERKFLEVMIRHHEGALTMVGRLLGTAGAAQDSEIYAFATDVDNDQRVEIARMRTLLRTIATR